MEHQQENMRTECLQWGTLRYVLRYPADYRAGERRPVLFFLHGAGTRGNEIEKLLNNPFFRLTAQHAEHPFVTVAPLCDCGTWFDCFETLKAFADAVAAAPYADSDRIYLVGTSMGGYGAWQLAMSMPERFAALVPICGGGMYWDAGRLVGLPIWAFHGEDDTTVFSEESRKMVEAVNRRGGNARLTLYPNTRHDAWTPTLTSPAVFEWLLSHRRGEMRTAADEYTDAKTFG